ncbi:MAG: lipocalin family protein [Woeseiaceae bacterium]|nr:lipocalin family protein [Woeseiaceae bacterium]
MALMTFLTFGCTGIPDGASVVDDFELDRYLGTWYEIARLDHRFERGMSNVTATYSLRDDGGVDVVNRGYLDKKGEWKEARGKAYFNGPSDEGRLKVSFFGPFYGAYNIIELDKAGYRYALIAGPDTDYLWILSRTPELDADIVESLVAKASSLGFNTDALIYVEHTR